MFHQLQASLPDMRVVFHPTNSASAILRHSTLGIVGYGSSGRQIGQLVKSFGGAVLAAKQNPSKRKDTGYIQRGMGDRPGRYADQIFSTPQLRAMLSQCDCVRAPNFSHTPYNRYGRDFFHEAGRLFD